MTTMAGQKTISARYTEPPPILVPSYQVSGTLTPDATGHYTQQGTFDGSPYYKHDLLDFYLWHHVVSGDWVISTMLGIFTYYFWNSDFPQILATYRPMGHSTGFAIVTQA